MVTKHYNNWNTVYHDQTYWRMHVITEDAVRLSAIQWQKEDYFGRYSTIREIRNEQWDKDKDKVESCKELNKW